MNTATAVTVIISVPGVIALVNLIKTRVSLGKWAALVAFALGISLNLAAWAAGAAYAGVDAFSVACVGALVGLGASGLYDVVGRSASTIENYAAPEIPVLEEGDQPIFSMPMGGSIDRINEQLKDPSSATLLGGMGGGRIIGVQKGMHYQLGGVDLAASIDSAIEAAEDGGEA